MGQSPRRQMAPMGALVATIILLGVYPSIVMDLFETAVEPIAEGLAFAVEAGTDAAVSGGGG